MDRSERGERAERGERGERPESVPNPAVRRLSLYLRQLEACRAHDVSGALDRIAAPTLVLHGDVDPLVPLGNGEHLAAGIAGARLKVYADTGHIPEVERADEFNADLLAFLAA